MFVLKTVVVCVLGAGQVEGATVIVIVPEAAELEEAGVGYGKIPADKVELFTDAVEAGDAVPLRPAPAIETVFVLVLGCAVVGAYE